MRSAGWLAGAGLALALAACAHYPGTTPLAAPRPAGGRYVFEQLASPEADDDVLVCLAFSGGGTRAAAFSYGVLAKLRQTRIVRPKDGKVESLLDEVDCLSSVSGGSFTAAYYALHGDRIFQDFRPSFLDRNVQSALVRKTLNPFNWPRLLSPYFSRIDLAAELYGATVFSGKTYADLIRNNRRPFVILNATDLATGDIFEFTQDQFDLIGSDLGSFPLARAVAASSAFPFLLTPISLTNHPSPPGYVPPAAIANGARDYHVNRRRFTWVSHQASYLDKSATPYVHVMDGGLADNIGVRALLRQFLSPTGFIARRTNTGKTSHLVFIAVNAKAGPPDDYNRHESPPGLVDVAFKTATVAMDNYSFETIELLRDQKRALEQARTDVARCQELARNAADCREFPSRLAIHVIDVGLDAITDRARRERLLAIPTSFSLPAADVDLLIAAAAEILDGSPDFQKLVSALRAPPPPPAPPPAPAPAPAPPSASAPAP